MTFEFDKKYIFNLYFIPCTFYSIFEINIIFLISGYNAMFLDVHRWSNHLNPPMAIMKNSTKTMHRMKRVIVDHGLFMRNMSDWPKNDGTSFQFLSIIDITTFTRSFPTKKRWHVVPVTAFLNEKWCRGGSSFCGTNGAKQMPTTFREFQGVFSRWSFFGKLAIFCLPNYFL